MFYVVKKGLEITQFHARYNKQSEAQKYAEELKKTFGHNYDVIHLNTVWTTQALDEAMSG